MPSTAVLERKKQMVADLSERIKNSCAGVVVDYKGINVEDDTKLRKELREAGVEYTVVKNTILGRAVEDAGLAGLEDILEGTTANAPIPRRTTAIPATGIIEFCPVFGETAVPFPLDVPVVVLPLLSFPPFAAASL